MRYPKHLKKNGVIGFPAPSFGCATEPYKSGLTHALEVFQGMGYRVLPGENAYVEEGIGISNTPQKCAEEFNKMYADSKIEAMISCGGGELMCEILPYIDFELLASRKPKWFGGYSDNTNLTFLLTTICDTASLYIPCAATFGMEPWHESIQDAFDLLIGKKKTFQAYSTWEEEGIKDEEHPLAPYNALIPREHKLFYNDRLYMNAKDSGISFEMEGRLLGGCMDCLVNLLGTYFDQVELFCERYKNDGIIWFLESCDLNVFAIRRAMWQMEQAGWFQYVKGFLIGRPANGEGFMNLDRYQAILSIAAEKNVPVIMDMDIGHRPPMLPLMVGSIAKVQVSGNDLSISFVER